MTNEFDWIEDCFQTYNEGNWLTNMTFRKAAVTQGDHDHCYFGWKKLSQYEYPDSEKQGYYSKDGNIWLCKSCFEELIKRNHKLPLIKNTVKDIETALLQFKTVVISLENERYIVKNAGGEIAVEHNGKTNRYDDILQMEREQLFYGKQLRDSIDDIFIGII